MSNKKFVMLFLLVGCLFISTTHNAIAGADWQAKQKQLFEQIPVKPGDVIDKSNWDKVKGLLPETELFGFDTELEKFEPPGIESRITSDEIRVCGSMFFKG